MKRFLLLFAFLTGFFSQAQILDPVDWKFDSKKINDTEFELIFTAYMDEHWAIYSQFKDSDDGPLPTEFIFEENDGYELINGVVEDELNKATKYDSVFEMVVTKFYNEARFSQRIKLMSDNATITGVINYMTCDDEQCIFKPDNPFLFQISASGETSAQQTTGEDIAAVLRAAACSSRAAKRRPRARGSTSRCE